MRLPPALLLASVVSFSAFGQTYTISIFAGGGPAVLNIPGTSANLSLSPPIAVDPAGNLFFVDQHIVVHARTAILTAVAGNGTPVFSGDNGPATSAQLNRPLGLAVDSAGNLYVSDSGNSRIRKVTNGVITTVAGNGTAGFSGDNGPATSVLLFDPMGVAADSAGNLYIADSCSDRIRKVTNGVMTTVAGTGTAGSGGDNGPATSAQVYCPMGVAADSAGNLYIADSCSDRIRKVTNGVMTTVAGTGTAGSGGDNGPATSAQVYCPMGVAADFAGNLYIADTGNGRIRMVSNGVITTVAGGGSLLGDNGPAIAAQLSAPSSVAVDSAGNLYIATQATAGFARSQTE